MISKYNDFILESKLELLLEAKLELTSNFRKALDSMSDNKIAKFILSLSDKDIEDLDRNLIDITDYEDKVSFVAQNRYDSTRFYKMIDSGDVYSGLSERAFKKGLIKNYDYYRGIDTPLLGTIEPFDVSDIVSSDFNRIVYKFTYKDDDGIERDVITGNNYLVRDFSNTTKTEISVGRFVRAFLRKLNFEFTDKEIEEFVNKYKAYIRIKNDIFSRFHEVSGEQIKEYYREENYQRGGGSLNNSCMRHEKCQPYLDIYSKNPEVCKLIILESDDEDDLISGRALLWTDTKGRKIMDRVYVSDSSLIELFIKYAIKNNYLYKQEQDFYADTFLVKDNKVLSKEESKVVIKLNDLKYSKYPYIDTFKNYYYEENILTNFYINKAIANELGIKSTWCYTLEYTDGSYLDEDEECPRCYGSGDARCPECDGEGCDECDGIGFTECPGCQ